MLNKFKKVIKKTYFWLLIIGVLLTIAYVSVIWVDDKVLATILNILAMLGSGIFCSAIVSLVFEINNSRRDEKERKIKRTYILNDIYNSTNAIILREIMYSSRFCLEFNNDRKINKTPISVKNAIDKTLTFFNETIDIYCSNKLTSETIKEKNEVHLGRVCKLGSSEYKKLLEEIKEIVSKSHIFLMDGTLSTAQIDCLNKMVAYIESLVNAEDNYNYYDMVLYCKIRVFRFLNEFLNVLEINTEKEKIFYRYE